jgi:hypothetical protein
MSNGSIVRNHDPPAMSREPMLSSSKSLVAFQVGLLCSMSLTVLKADFQDEQKAHKGQPMLPLALYKPSQRLLPRGGLLLVATGTTMVWVTSIPLETTPREPSPVPSQVAVPVICSDSQTHAPSSHVTVTLVPASASNRRGLQLTLGKSALALDSVSSRMDIAPRTRQSRFCPGVCPRHPGNLELRRGLRPERVDNLSPSNAEKP